MARIRSIKPEFFTSLSIASLDLPTRLTFIGLWTHCDDEGRCVDEARLIKAALWPLDDRTAADIEKDLGALSESSLIARYEVGGRRYLAVCGWAEHQRINRPTKSKFPSPDDPAVRPVALVACANEARVSVQERLTDDSLSTHDRKGKEQGTGNREQGKDFPPPAGTATPRRDSGKPINAGDVIAAYMDGAKEAKLPTPAETLRGRIGKQARALLADKNTDHEALLVAGRNAGAAGWNDLAVQMQRDAVDKQQQNSNGNDSRFVPGTGARAHTKTAEELENEEIKI